MKQLLKFEIKRVIRTKWIWIILALECILVTLDFICYYHNYFGQFVMTTVAQSWIGLDYQFVFNTLWLTIFPILGVIPYGASYFWDIKSGYVKNICVKVSRKNYFFVKSLVTFFVSSMMIIIPLTINLITCMCFFPLRIPEKLFFLGGTIDSHMLSQIYYSSTLLYIIIFILIDGFFEGMLSLYCLCISDLTSSNFTTLSTPYAVYLITSAGILGENSVRYSFMYMVDPLQTYEIDGRIVSVIMVVMFAVAIGIIMKKSFRKDFL